MGLKRNICITLLIIIAFSSYLLSQIICYVDKIRILQIISSLLLFASIAACFYIFLLLIKINNKKELIITYFKKTREDLFVIGLIIVIETILLFMLYHSVHLNQPLYYTGNDALGCFYYAKIIKEYGISLTNPMEGGFAGANMFDYPYSDSISFLLIKLIGLFILSPYLIVNIFYFFCYYLITIISYIVCRKLSFSKPTSILVAILYSFNRYIQFRYPHLWLIPYFMLPIAVLISINIIKDDSLDKNPNKFVIYFLLSYFCAFTGFYYAFFSCALFSIAFVIRSINDFEGKKKIKYCYLLFIFATIIGVFTNLIPNLLYWHINGLNPNSEIITRSMAETEYYGLKLIQLLLPGIDHRISLLARIQRAYTNNFSYSVEAIFSSLGIIASVGLMVLVLNVFRKNQKNNLTKTNSMLVISLFFVATIGGISSILTLFFRISAMRCYNRISIVIMFICLLEIGYMLDCFFSKNTKKLIIICGILLSIGFFDQTVKVKLPNNKQFLEMQSFIHKVDEKLEDGAFVFVLPFDHWPTGRTYKNHICYLESNNIHWSYGAVQGRSEDRWQEKVSSLETTDMIEQIKMNGYDGLYLDSSLFTLLFNKEKTDKKIEDINNIIGPETLVSQDGVLHFWMLK